MTGPQSPLHKAFLCIAACSFLTFSSGLMAFDGEDPKPAPEKKQDEKQDEKSDDAAVDDNEDGGKEKKDAKDKPKKDKTLEQLVKKDTERMEGIFTLYRDTKTGSLMMEIREDQLDKEYISFSNIVDGVTEAGSFRGLYLSEKVIKISKDYKKIIFTEMNPHFYFDPNNNLSKAQDANISTSILSTSSIIAESEAGDSYLINVDALFKSEAIEQIKPSRRPGAKPTEQFMLGKLTGSKTLYKDIKNYPENLSVTVDYVYSNPAPMNHGSGLDITDARNVTIKVQHTLMAMPENDYKPRFDDPRIGYFTTYVNDMTSTSATPWRDLIHRWNLIKKDPTAKVSEPVEPIVWWIENTTPEELRPIIKDAAETWNVAFEQAGFKNALIVKIQPDDADWDADDIRYNVLRWTSSPRPPFGGYGPSFVNPRTGQILAADVMLEYSFLTNRLNQSEIFDKQLLGTAEETDEEKSFTAHLHQHTANCSLAGHLQLNNMLGATLNTVLNEGSSEQAKALLRESIYYLILHELGHTLGLNHNMKATQARSYETVYDITKQGNGLAGSVMDYPSINFAPPGKNQAHYYTIRPGDYDMWAIKFGYDPEMDDPTKREALLARSTEKTLAFGNDADDMRSPGSGIDPRINIYDMTDDAIQFAEDRLNLDAKAMSELEDRLVKPGEGYQALTNAYLTVTSDMAWQGRVISRYIGGVKLDRAFADQPGATTPYQPVSKAKQKHAMALLRTHIFGPDAFAVDPKLVQHLARQRRGFLGYGSTEDPKIHSRVSIIQADILSQILHPLTLQRVIDSSLYGNDYSLLELMQDLTASIFEDDARGAVNSFRQELQIMYVNRLIGILKGGRYNYSVRSVSLTNLKNIRRDMARWRGDAATRAHRDHVTFLIDKALEVYKGS